MWGRGAAFEPLSPHPVLERPARPCCSRVLLASLLAALSAHRFAFEFDAVCIVHQPVENRIGYRRIADLGVPGGDRHLAGQHRCPGLIAGIQISRKSLRSASVIGAMAQSSTMSKSTFAS